MNLLSPVGGSAYGIAWKARNDSSGYKLLILFSPRTGPLFVTRMKSSVIERLTDLKREQFSNLGFDIR